MFTLSDITGVLLSTAKRGTTTTTYRMLTKVFLPRLTPYTGDNNGGGGGPKCEPLMVGRVITVNNTTRSF